MSTKNLNEEFQLTTFLNTCHDTTPSGQFMKQSIFFTFFCLFFVAFHDFIRQMLVVDPSFRPTINQVQEHLASLSVSTGLNATEGAELDLELSSLNNSNLVQESASNESLSSASITTTSEAPVSE